jgi:hypothetical protein
MFSSRVKTSQSYHSQDLYINHEEDPYGVLIGRRPTTLFEAQERACEIEENLASSPLQEEECLKETLQINQIDDFASPNFPSDIRTYLQEEKKKQLKGHLVS